MRLPEPGERKAALALVAKRARELSEALSALDLLSQAELGGADGWAHGHAVFKQTKEAVSRFAPRASDAAEQLGRSKPGPPANDALCWLVEALADIWEHFTEEKFSRSNKEAAARHFVDAVIATVEPHIPEGQVDKLMRREIERRGLINDKSEAN